MKKLFSLLGVGILMLALTGCGEEEIVIEDVGTDEVVDDLHDANDEVEVEVVYADPESEIELPAEIPAELDEPTTPPPTAE